MRVESSVRTVRTGKKIIVTVPFIDPLTKKRRFRKLEVDEYVSTVHSRPAPKQAVTQHVRIKSGIGRQRNYSWCGKHK